MKAEKVLLALVVSMLFASVALASFRPQRLALLFPEWKAVGDAPYTGDLVVQITEGKATGISCGQAISCPDARELLTDLGTASFIVNDSRLIVASRADQSR